MLSTRVQSDGYAVYPATPGSLIWARAANAAVEDLLRDPVLRATWLQCQGTWFVGVDVLPNGPDGALSGTALQTPALNALSTVPKLHRAQVSVTFPGYPKPRNGESEAGFRYRLNRDAAHVDGILAEGPDKRRFVREPHAFILGIALSEADAGASPLVVWPGSHTLMQQAFQAAMQDHPPATLSDVDVTEIYQSTRRSVFANCPRVTVPLKPGQSVLLHPMLLHGVAPWEDGAKAEGGRRVAYFRPLARSVSEWLAI